MRPPWKMAVQMLRSTTMRSVASRKVDCQLSESILVMISTAMKRVAITVSEPSSLTFSRNLCPYTRFRMTKTAFGMLEDIAENTLILMYMQTA